MKISFMELYAEVGINYKITNDFFYYFRDKLNTVKETIKHYDKLWNGQEYELLFTISATEKDKKILWGPTVSPKYKIVFFTIFIPFKRFTDKKEEEIYIISIIKEGFRQLCEKYKMNFHAYDVVFDEIVQDIKNDNIPKKILDKKSPE